jgi:hypothetical protein
MACADADGFFVIIDVGDYGRNSDSHVMKSSNFGKQFSISINIPADKRLPNDENGMPFPVYYIGDETFSLTRHLMRPYPRRSLDNTKKLNDGLSRARKSVQCAFGMLFSKFRVLETSINVKVDYADDIVKAACVLHNCMRIREGVLLTPEGLNRIVNEYTEGQKSSNLLSVSVKPARETARARDLLAEYLGHTDNSIQWQRNNE